MHFIKNIRVCQKRAEAGFGTEVDHSAAIFCVREVTRVGVAKNTPAQGHELARA